MCNVYVHRGPSSHAFIIQNKHMDWIEAKQNNGSASEISDDGKMYLVQTIMYSRYYGIALCIVVIDCSVRTVLQTLNLIEILVQKLHWNSYAQIVLE